MDSINCKSAEDFLDIISPRNDIWKEGASPKWIFRGQRDSKWELIPSASRAEMMNNFISKGALRLDAADGQVVKETFLLKKTIDAIDLQGNLLLGDSTAFREKWFDFNKGEGINKALLQPKLWPGEELIPIMAFAQHSGVPTRLLDWTKRAYIAAYFAASDAAVRFNEAEERSKKIAVWALNTEMIHTVREPRIEVKKVPNGANHNVRCQLGCFTLVREEVSRGKAMVDKSLDRIINDKWEIANRFPLKKITLAFTEIGKLLRYLTDEGIEGATMFGGAEGVVKSLKEKAFWQN